MKYRPSILAFLILALTLLILAACGASNESPSVSKGKRSLSAISTPTDNSSCQACALATLSVAQTQQTNNTDLQAAATANIVVANAQATLNSLNATSSAVQAQQRNQANIVIAQITATAAVANANIQATLASSAQTQSVAQTQNAIQQTQIAAQATTNAQATLTVQSQQTLVAATQTVVEGQIMRITQVAVATAQQQAVQERLSQEQQLGSAMFIWELCVPSFILMLGGIFLYGSWRWLGNRQLEQQRQLEGSPVRSHTPRVRVIDHQVSDSEPYVADRGRYQLTKPDDQVGKWLDEVKREISSDEKKDEENENADDQS